MNHGMEWPKTGPAPDGYVTYRLTGDCDLYNAPSFQRELSGAIASGERRIRLDCSGLEYLDSTGVGAIIRLLQAAKASGAELRFSGLAGAPRKVLRLCNVLTLIREEGEALA